MQPFERILVFAIGLTLALVISVTVADMVRTGLTQASALVSVSVR